MKDVKIMCLEYNPPYIFSHVVFYIFASAHPSNQTSNFHKPTKLNIVYSVI